MVRPSLDEKDSSGSRGRTVLTMEYRRVDGADL